MECKPMLQLPIRVMQFCIVKYEFNLKFMSEFFTCLNYCLNYFYTQPSINVAYLSEHKVFSLVMYVLETDAKMFKFQLTDLLCPMLKLNQTIFRRYPYLIDIALECWKLRTLL